MKYLVVLVCCLPHFHALLSSFGIKPGMACPNQKVRALLANSLKTAESFCGP